MCEKSQATLNSKENETPLISVINSPMGERQTFPVQTNRTFIGFLFYCVDSRFFIDLVLSMLAIQM